MSLWVSDEFASWTVQYRNTTSWRHAFKLHYVVIQGEHLKVYRNEQEFEKDPNHPKRSVCVTSNGLKMRKSGETKHPWLLYIDRYYLSFESEDDLEDCREYIRIANRLSTVYRKVTNKTPYPMRLDIAILNRRFKKMLEKLRLPPKRSKKLMSSLTNERKWRVLRGKYATNKQKNVLYDRETHTRTEGGGGVIKHTTSVFLLPV